METDQCTVYLYTPGQPNQKKEEFSNLVSRYYRTVAVEWFQVRAKVFGQRGNEATQKKRYKTKTKTGSWLLLDLPLLLI